MMDWPFKWGQKKLSCFRKSAGWKFFYHLPARIVACVSEYMFFVSNKKKTHTHTEKQKTNETKENRTAKETKEEKEVTTGTKHSRMNHTKFVKDSL